METPLFNKKEEETIPLSKFLEFVNNEDNHTEGELGNSCIDVKTLIETFTPKTKGMETLNKKEIYVCPLCNSDNVQGKFWVNLNTMVVEDCVEDEDDFCDDCQNHIRATNVTLNANAKVIGFQVVGEGKNEGEIHPDMDGSFCIYNLTWCMDRVDEGNWRLLTIWEGDVEEPTMMFEDCPRY